MRFDQSSPVQPVSESRGGTLSVTNERTNGRKSLCLILDVNAVVILNPESHVLFAHSIINTRLSFSFVGPSVCHDHATPLSHLNLEMLSMEGFLSQIISRPGPSQGLLYKHRCDSLICSATLFLPKSLWRHQNQMVRDSASSYKIEYHKWV